MTGQSDQPQPTPATVSDDKGRNEHHPNCGKWAQTVLHGRQLMGDLPCTCNLSALSPPQDESHRPDCRTRSWLNDGPCTCGRQVTLTVPVAQTPQEPSQELK